MILLSSEEIYNALPMNETIETMKVAFSALSNGNATVPLRSRLEIPENNGTTLIMPSKVRLNEKIGISIKIVSVYPDNPKKGKPTIHASVLVINEEDGSLIAILEGASLTAIRTGAGSGAATDLLANPNSNTVAIIGSGVQAKTQLQAVSTVRNIETVFVYSPNREHANQFAREISGVGNIPKNIVITNSANKAVSQAEIVCTATNSFSPVFDASAVNPGTHINAIGSYTAEMQEIPTETMKSGLIYVDSLSSCLAESGEIAIPLQQGDFSQEHIQGEIGDLINQKIPGRQSEEDITIFKSVGVAVQDTLAAKLAISNAQKLNIGTIIDWQQTNSQYNAIK